MNNKIEVARFLRHELCIGLRESLDLADRIQAIEGGASYESQLTLTQIQVEREKFQQRLLDKIAESPLVQEVTQ